MQTYTPHTLFDYFWTNFSKKYLGISMVGGSAGLLGTDDHIHAYVIYIAFAVKFDIE